MKKCLNRDHRAWASMPIEERRLRMRELAKEIEDLRKEFSNCIESGRSAAIKSRLNALLRQQKDLAAVSTKKKKFKTPVPESYLKTKKETQETARKLSKRDRLVATFVQGGAPGSRRR